MAFQHRAAYLPWLRCLVHRAAFFWGNTMIDKKDFQPAKDPCNCAAFGCPMLGTMTHSTTGADEWLCFLHFGKPSASWQRITAELHRLDWLAKAVRGIRVNYRTDMWPDTYRLATQSIRFNQRNDLLKTESESVPAWAYRLEMVLSNECNALGKEAAAAEKREHADTWQKVGMALPVMEGAEA
jgi:hypothetical protein